MINFVYKLIKNVLINFDSKRCVICTKKTDDLFMMKDGGSGGCCLKCFEKS